jgi:hypothetical protein
MFLADTTHAAVKATNFRSTWRQLVFFPQTECRSSMLRRSHTVAALGAALLLSCGPVIAQNAPAEAPQSTPAPAAPEPDTADAGREECGWSGRRVVTLLWRDDINGAREHLRFYDRFTCPDARLRDAFRCVIRSGEFDPQNPESVSAKVSQCWRESANSSAARPHAAQ